MDLDDDFENEIRIVIIGNCGVGKTSILNCYARPHRYSCTSFCSIQR